MNPEDSRMSGGPMSPEKAAAEVILRKLIEGTEDVHRIVALEPHPSFPDRWLYMIETPFATFPRFVVGTTDDANDQPEVQFRCGAEWSAQDEWNRVMREAGDEVR